MQEKNGVPLEGELELINKYTRREFGEDDLYVFTVILCDNEIDRDFERFDDKALDELAKLFVGVTGIADHDPVSENQRARIFSCTSETVPGRTTSDGRPYKHLRARAYVPKDFGESFILAIDSGIRKEVSVGCAAGKRTCSICGKDISLCGHIRGRRYEGRLCYSTLSDITDAYEWSFVAVPAQRNAGVVKSYSPEPDSGDEIFSLPGLTAAYGKGSVKGENMEEIIKKLESGKQQTFSAEEMIALHKNMEELRKKAEDGEYYREVLTNEVKKLSLLAFPQLDAHTLGAVVKGLSVKELDDLKRAFESRTDELYPAKPQLAAEGNGIISRDNNISYQNI